MTTLSLAQLLVQESKATIYATALSIATAIGVPVTTWQPGDPTRSLFHVESELVSSLEGAVVGYVASGFLDYASGVWLKILAKQVYNVDVPDATYAETTLTLTNNSGAVYDFDAGDLTVKDSTTGKTYRNTTGGHLAAKVGSTPGTLDVTVVADEAGSASTAAAGEIDALVTTYLGVTCSNATAAVGTDEQSEDTTRALCRAKLGTFSPNGPADAYRFVALTPALTGISTVTDARVYSDSDTGDVTVYLRGPSGAVSGPDVAAVLVAILKYCTPLCITPAVVSCTAVTVDVTYQLWVYKSVNKSADEVKADVLTALEKLFATQPIGGDIISPPAATGYLYNSLIESTIKGVSPKAFRCVVSFPGSDTALSNNQVAALGTVTATVNIVADP